MRKDAKNNTFLENAWLVRKGGGHGETKRVGGFQPLRNMSGSSFPGLNIKKGSKVSK